jgi:phosphoribosylformimino-5-aminoimidazole carboxamide ribotide isomerase
MVILPVLDLMAGQVVRGVAGRRDLYRPVVSTLVASSDPGAVARAFAGTFGLWELYVADLDAIGGAAPARDHYTRLRADGFRLWVDAGVRQARQAIELGSDGIECVVIGLETVSGPEEVAAAVLKLGERAAFSLDLYAGKPLGDAAAWQASDAESIAARAIDLGVRRLIVLDLANVGTATGPGSGGVYSRLARSYPDVAIYAGGGVRNLADLRRMKDAGLQGALVASALHDGSLSREDLVHL